MSTNESYRNVGEIPDFILSTRKRIGNKVLFLHVLKLGDHLLVISILFQSKWLPLCEKERCVWQLQFPSPLLFTITKEDSIQNLFHYAYIKPLKMWLALCLSHMIIQEPITVFGGNTFFWLASLEEAPSMEGERQSNMFASPLTTIWKKKLLSQ